MKQLAQVSGVPVPPPLANFKFRGDQSFFDNPNLLGVVLTRALQFAIVSAGLVFFVKLVSGGFLYLTSAGDQGKVQAATKEITNAVIGLIIVISTFFIIQILETILGIKVL